MNENRRARCPRQLATAVTAFGLLFLLTACDIESLHTVKGSGTERTSRRAVAAFTRVDLKGDARVTIAAGRSRSVTVRGDDNLIGLVRTEVAGDKLVVSTRRPYTSRIGLLVAIHVPTLAGVDISGSGTVGVENVRDPCFAADISGSGVLDMNGTAKQLDISISGDGVVRLSGLATREVRADISGSGDVEASGTTDALVVDIPGSGRARLEGLIARTAHVDISGSGDVRLRATRSLEAEISGDGIIAYAGNPLHVSKDISGSGMIWAL